MSDLIQNPAVPSEANGFPVVAAIKDSVETYVIVCDRGDEYPDRFAVWLWFIRFPEEGSIYNRPVCHRGDYYYDRPSAILRMVSRAGISMAAEYDTVPSAQ